MPIILEPVPRFDSRGLPEGMDLYRLYRYRYDTLKKDAVGFESFLYKLIPFDLAGSFAFAIDPTARYKVAPGTITAANRTKYRASASVLLNGPRSRIRSYYKDSWSQVSNYKNIAFCSSPYLNHDVVSIPNWQSQSLTRQEPIPDKLKDTTSRTRLLGSHQGELEFFKSSMFSPSRSHRWVDKTRRYTDGVPTDPACTAAGGIPDYEVGSDEIVTDHYGPTASTLSESVFTALATSEKALCREISARNALSMFKGISPFTRSYSLARNVAELKDLARSMASAKRTADDLKKLWSSLSSSPKTRAKVFDLASNAAQNVPSEYLSFHFGWKQLHKDLSDLTKLPEKIGKKMNFLIERSGKPSTFRSTRSGISGATGVSGFSYETDDKEFLAGEPGLGITSRIEREWETRLVINAIFDFPPINVPHLRRRFFADQVGLIPRFIDVYNIVPWTWLLDWFTGLGNYLELIEEINHDPLLINWGMITTNIRGKLVTEFESTSPIFTLIHKNNVQQSYTGVGVRNRHTSILEYECQTRQNCANVFDVKQTTIAETLSPYQLSILGAILAQRIDNTRAGAFSPRS
jgi:hypothetical protein